MLSKNIFFNFIGKIYFALIALIITPQYFQNFETEAFGLIGIYLMFQAWSNLLDIGLSPALGRQAAISAGNVSNLANFRIILRGFEIIFLLISLVVLVLFFSNYDWISTNWLKFTTLSNADVSYSLSLIIFLIVFRLFISLYKGGVIGFQDQVWLNLISIFTISLNYIGGLIIVLFVSKDITYFFEYQMIIILLEFILLKRRLYSRLPKIKKI